MWESGEKIVIEKSHEIFPTISPDLFKFHALRQQVLKLSISSVNFHLSELFEFNQYEITT